MSLLTSLIRASTQFQQAMEKSPPEKNPGQAPQPAAAAQPATPGSTTDDRYTWSGDAFAEDHRTRSPRLAMTEYKQTVGQDLAFVRETLRHKLAEYAQPPATRLSVSKDAGGNVSVEGNLPEGVRDKIGKDLNHNKPFREAFSRLSINEPTLEFVDTALKLNKAYGVNNPLLETLVSDNQQFNGLQDLVHRYDSLRRSVGSEQIEAAGNAKHYAFSLNTRA